MRLAYFSPMPPDRTGIAEYSRHLVAALAAECDVDVFTQTFDATPIPGQRMFDFVRDPGLLHTLRDYDQVLYHLGNNPFFHLDIWRASNRHPGVVCLHDVVLYYLAAGVGRGMLLRELLLERGPGATEALRRIEEGSPDGNLLRYPHPSRHPCVRGMLSGAREVVVHGQASADLLREEGYRGPVEVIPLLHYGDERLAPHEIAAVRAELGFETGDFVLGVFGFIGPTKRIEQVLEALARHAATEPGSRVKLLIVGEGEPIESAILRHGLDARVRRAGFVDDARFRRYLAAIDAFVNLRYPSHGESSASLVQAMALGKPSVVTDHAWFAELPEGTVVKVPYDAGEVDALVEAMRSLSTDAARARALGEAARAYVETHHAPASVARRFVEVLGRLPSMRAAAVRPVFAPEPTEGFSPAEYFARRGASLVP